MFSLHVEIESFDVTKIALKGKLRKILSNKICDILK